MRSVCIVKTLFLRKIAMKWFTQNDADRTLQNLYNKRDALRVPKWVRHLEHYQRTHTGVLSTYTSNTENLLVFGGIIIYAIAFLICLRLKFIPGFFAMVIFLPGMTVLQRSLQQYLKRTKTLNAEQQSQMLHTIYAVAQHNPRLEEMCHLLSKELSNNTLSSQWWNDVRDVLHHYPRTEAETIIYKHEQQMKKQLGLSPENLTTPLVTAQKGDYVIAQKTTVVVESETTHDKKETVVKSDQQFRL